MTTAAPATDRFVWDDTSIEIDDVPEEKAFAENKHPRGRDGKFTDKREGLSSPSVTAPNDMLGGYTLGVAEDWVKKLPAKWLAKSPVRDIVAFADAGHMDQVLAKKDMRSGHDTQGWPTGAYDFETDTLYMAINSGQNEAPHMFLRQLAASILGKSADQAEVDTLYDTLWEDFDHTGFGPLPNLSANVVEDKDAWVTKNVPETWEADDDSLIALGDYKSTGFATINAGLRKGDLDKRSSWAKKSVTEIDRAFANFALKTAEPISVFRGIGYTNTIHKLAEGDEFVDNGFVSTSLDASVASGIGGSVLMQIDLPVGTPYIYMDAQAVVNAADTVASEEYELLLKRGSHFRVHHVNQNFIGVELLPDAQ